MKIGNLSIENNVFLAPMAGVTDLPFRKLCIKYGCGFVYSEMVSAKGIYYKDKKTKDLMVLDDGEKPAAIQIFGSDPKIMGSVVSEVESFGCAIIDINMGCPTPKIVNNGDGSALLKDLKLAGKVVKSVVDSAAVPVTVKIRKGWDENSINAVEAAKVIEANGAAAIAVHGRTREQFYRGVADWDIIKQVKNAVKIPVIGNGDIFSAEDAKKMFEHTGCDAVMIGRGAQGNPFIFREINEMFKTGKTDFYVSSEERISACRELILDMVSEKGEVRGVKEARKHIAWFIKGMKNSSKIKDMVFKMTDYEEIIRVLETLVN